MKAFAKTLFGDSRNLAGVALIVALAVVLTGFGHSGWAVFVIPATSLGVVAWLAHH